MSSLQRIGAAMVVVAALSACGGSGGGGEDTVGCCKQLTYSVGGTISGLGAASMELTITDETTRATQDLPITGTGAAETPFTFRTALGAPTSFIVSIKTPPAGLGCSATNERQELRTAPVTNVRIVCESNSYTVGGTVTGLSGAGLQLRNNGGDTIAIAPTTGSEVAFTFRTSVSNSTGYAVTVFTQPSNPTQTCVTVSGASGPASGANITNVRVHCDTDRYSVGGTINGLQGAGLRLRINNGEEISIPAGSTAFTFPTTLLSGANYSVAASGPVLSPSQICDVVANTVSGQVAAANVTGIVVNCTTLSYTIGGSVTGLTGSGLRLRNGANNEILAVAAGSSNFTFVNAMASGASYGVTVDAQPSNPTQTCSVTSGSGPVGNGPVTTIAVQCQTQSFTVGGAVSGLSGSGLVLRNNGGNDLAVTSNGSFVFTAPVASGSAYAVTVRDQPTGPHQTCTITNGSNQVGAANVTSVAVNCITNTYTVGGTVTGLTGTGLVLRNNNGNDLPIGANGAFVFGSAVTSGGAYSISVATQPSTPQQVCLVANGSGTVVSAQVTNIAIDCLSRFGKFVYVANTGASEPTLWVFAIDAQTGVLTPAASPPVVNTSRTIRTIHAHPSGNFAYSIGGGPRANWYGVDQLTINQANGQLTWQTNTGPDYFDSEQPDQNVGIFMQTDTQGTALYIAGINVAPHNSGANVNGVADRYTVNASSGSLTYANRTFTGSGSSVPTTFVTPTNALISLSPLRAVRPNGAHLYVADAAANTITQYTIAANGSFSATGTPPVATGATPTALAVDRSGQFAYALSPTDATISQYSINAATGALSALSPATIATCSQAASFAVEASSRFAYVSCANDSTVQQFRITTSGALAYMGAVNTSPAGTPGTIAIAGPGL